jgi:hypothetical protein
MPSLVPEETVAGSRTPWSRAGSRGRPGLTRAPPTETRVPLPGLRPVPARPVRLSPAVYRRLRRRPVAVAAAGSVDAPSAWPERARDCGSGLLRDSWIPFCIAGRAALPLHAVPLVRTSWSANGSRAVRRMQILTPVLSQLLSQAAVRCSQDPLAAAAQLVPRTGLRMRRDILARVAAFIIDRAAGRFRACRTTRQISSRCASGRRWRAASL